MIEGGGGGVGELAKVDVDISAMWKSFGQDLVGCGRCIRGKE